MLSYDSPASLEAQKPVAATSMSSATPLRASKTSRPTSQPKSVENSAERYHHIWLVTGPAGCGKSSVAESLASALEIPFIEGDSFHPATNVEKMRSGIPLTDADRWDWLTALREESMRRISRGVNGVVLTCSALKRKYRDVIRVAAYYDRRLMIHFIYLDATEEVLLQRVANRKNHFMGANMVHSQFEALERPSADETDAITIDVSRTLEEVEADALGQALKTLNNDA